MTVSYKQFQAEDGFKSLGFLVDENGNFSIANLNTTSAYKINGVQVLTQTGLGSTVVSSNLTSLGTLSGLTVNSNSNVGITTSSSISLTASSNLALSGASISITSTGQVTLNSGTTGTIDNVDIGTTTPGNGTFSNLTATDTLFVGSQNIKALSAAFAVALS